MTPADQVEVLNLVTEMGTVLHEVRTQDAQLRADFRKSSADITARLGDFERRVALAEARSAMSAAREGGAPRGGGDPAAPPSAAPDAAKTGPVVLTRAEAAVPASGSGTAKRYRVQAASPGLALLAQVDRGGGDGAQLQVVVGDSIPDYGKIKSIAQKGTIWVVTAEHGVIQ